MGRVARHRAPPAPPRRSRWPGRVALLALLLAVAAALFAGMVSGIDAPPRSLGPFLQHRLSGHHPLLAAAGEWLNRMLTRLDRGEYRSAQPLKLRIGARSESGAASMPSSAKLVLVASSEHAVQAIEQAQPGDVITFEPGTYRFAGGHIAIRRPGRADAGITVRAARPGTVFLEFEMTDGFVVGAPYWTFENLTIRGVCQQHSDCEHAFHVVAGATHFIARNNTLIDFNAHIKVNGQDRRFPDDGLIDGNTLTNAAPRQTGSPVAMIDLVGVSRWTVRGNLLTDFVKAQGDRISYGAFAKGGGSDNRFERNVVWCEFLLRGTPGWRIGLSLGGGGTERDYCRDGACITEQDAGVVESNLVAGCSDDGIYVNRGAASRIMHNTLVDTGGVVVRFAESSADVEGNLVDGAIRSRDGGLVRADDNLQTDMTSLYVGQHPQRSLFRDSLALDFAWRLRAPRRSRAAESSRDLCGALRPAEPAYGAFEDFSVCLDSARPLNPP